jgi:hypothetical protein
MKHIFDKTTCWNIFDHAADPERYWALHHAGQHDEARRAAIWLTLRHPLTMIPVIISCARCG